MALDFLCVEIIARGKKIKIPEKANCYRCDSKRGVSRIKFFRFYSAVPKN